MFDLMSFFYGMIVLFLIQIGCAVILWKRFTNVNFDPENEQAISEGIIEEYGKHD